MRKSTVTSKNIPEQERGKDRYKRELNPETRISEAMLEQQEEMDGFYLSVQYSIRGDLIAGLHLSRIETVARF